MMKRDLNKTENSFVAVIRNAFPGKSTIHLVDILSKLIPLGKDAIYRRLNGQVQFTLKEALDISKCLNISLDNIYTDTPINKAIFNLNLINIDKPAVNYADILEGYLEMFDKIKDSTNTRVRSSYNIMPYSFFLDYDYISKFHLYKWLYLVNSINHWVAFSDFKMPQKIRKIEKRFSEATKVVKTASFIIARDIFENFAKDIVLFYEMDLLNVREKDKLKSNLLAILEYAEKVTMTGYNNHGNKVTLYLANIDLDASYTHFESDDFEMSHIRVFSNNGIESHNPEFCAQTKVWIDSIQNYSTLISCNNYVHRINYFEEQKTLVKEILK